MKKKIVILGFTRQEYAIIMLALRNVYVKIYSLGYVQKTVAALSTTHKCLFQRFRKKLLVAP